MEPIDGKNSVHWALASVGNAGLVVGVYLFDLVNLVTGRAHGMVFTAAGPTLGAGCGSAAQPNYTEFRTRRPVNFRDFDGAGARILTGSLSGIGGFSASEFEIDDTYGFGTLARIYDVSWTWGPSVSVALASGVLAVTYGAGTPMGELNVARHFEGKGSVSASPRATKVNIHPFENAIVLPGDALFNFNSAVIRTDAINALQKSVPAIVNRKRPIVSIEGHTDSVGSKDYNKSLSLRRATAVKDWMVKKGVVGASHFRVKGWGEERPVAPNKSATGADNPSGRQKNRRVEIVFE